MACRYYLLQLSLTALLAASAVQAAGVKVRFDPTSPAVGPFPSDALTVADSGQKTGLRINLPMPDCSKEPSTCAELAIVNQLDGFSLEPRLRVRFSAAVNPDTLKDGVFIYWLNLLTTEEQGQQPFGTITPINKIEYDPATNTAYAEPDQLLAQHRRYALLVTSAVKDLKGDPVETDAAFLTCLQQPGAYCDQVAMAVGRAGPRLAPQDIVAASVFTTLSATIWMEKARAAIQTSNPGLAMATPRAVFPVSNISKITLHADVGSSKFQDLAVPGPELLAGVGQIAFGSIPSPLFLNQQLVIPPTPTLADVPLPPVTQQVAFNAFLPAAPPPPDGYPVVVFGMGMPGDGFNGARLASAMAARGFATISITNFGNGYGAATTMLVTDKTGSVTSVPRPGRGVDIDGNGTIDPYEGCVMVAGSQVVGMRDCIRQTALDNMQLIRAIQAGIDLNGDGTVDLSRNLIFYVGYSFGGLVGSVLNAVEPAIQSAVLNSAAGTMVESAVWSPLNRLVVLAMLAYRQPVLINRPGPDFNAALTLRNQPVRIIDVPGAIAIQEVLERIEWNNMLGDALSFAPHLSWSPLPGVSPKPVLFQFAWGDLSLPNPLETAVVRAANTPGMVSLFRTDVAWVPNMPLTANPHDSAFDFYTSAASAVVARAFQAQMAMFLSGDGRSVPQVNDLVRWPFMRDLFFVPKVLPEDLNF